MAMLKHRMAALAAGALLAGLLAGCETNDGRSVAGPEARTGAQGAAPGIPTGLALSPISYVDASGHSYEIRMSVNADGDLTAISHLRDGQVLAIEGGADPWLSVYSGGTLIITEYLTDGGGLTPLPGPQRMAAAGPCLYEWQNYAIASTAMMLIAQEYNSQPTEANLVRLNQAIRTFWNASKSLIRCRKVNAGT
jgi:hypothetical protein